MMVLEADLVVFTEIVLHVGPQRIEDALKKQEGKKKPGGGLSCSCAGELVPRGHLGTAGHKPTSPPSF